MADTVDFDADELAMLRQLFRDEAHEALEVITARALNAGATAPADGLGEMMRLTHTLKGAAGTVGMNVVVDLAHRLESALAQFQAGTMTWNAVAGDRVVEIADGLRAVIDALAEGAGEVETAAVRRTISELSAGRVTTQTMATIDISELNRISTSTTPPPFRTLDASTAAPASSTTPDTLGTIPPPLTPVTAAPPDPEELAVSDGVPTPTTASDSTKTSVIAGSFLRVEAQRIDELMSSAGELLFDRTRIERRVQALRTLARDVARSRQEMRDQTSRLAVGPARDALLAIEDVLAHQTTALSQASAALLDEVEALRRTIGELQRGLTRVRMQTARSLFLHLARAARTVSRAVGARVELRTTGEDTEFDKSVAEQIVDPMIQLLRNAIVHGIEPPAERVLRGKPATGLVTLRARQDGPLLVIELSDDGRGIDPKGLRERFVATGRWTAARAQLASDDDVLHALFDPGVSSRDDADELAGRGIGLDLVRETIARLGGEVGLSSTPGRGTTFTLRLPLSTAVTQATLFKVGGQVYALPHVHVVDTVQVEPGVSMELRREEVPILRLEELLETGDARGAPAGGRRAGIVVTYAGRTLVCTVDKVVGPREIVVKPLGPLLAPLSLYAGATISASGKVQLILDTAQLVRRAYPGVQLAEPDTGAAMAGLSGRALVVDDSRAIREAMTSMLAREGWIVDVAEDGARAWQMASQLRYDLVVTDLEMPVLSGFDLIARLRNEARLAQIPVIVITSRASPENRRRARDLGVRALVGKPITRRKLLEALAMR
jgi:chemotaxis protein histidine kinase CheA/CheY-like chemotaxis protein